MSSFPKGTIERLAEFIQNGSSIASAIYNCHYEIEKIDADRDTIIYKNTGDTYQAGAPDIRVVFYCAEDNQGDAYFYGEPHVDTFPALDAKNCEYYDTIQGTLNYWADTTGVVCTSFNQAKFYEYQVFPEDYPEYYE